MQSLEAYHGHPPSKSPQRPRPMNLIIEGIETAGLVFARLLLRELFKGPEKPKFERDALALPKNTSVARREGNFAYVRQQVRAQQHEVEPNETVTVGGQSA